MRISNHFSIDNEKQALVSNNLGELFMKQNKRNVVLSLISYPQKVLLKQFEFKE
jgi:hypothetical protein